MIDMKTWLWLAAFLISVTIGSLLYKGIIKSYEPYDCAAQIENLPDYLYNDINNACDDWQAQGVVSRRALRKWFRHNEVRFSEYPFWWEEGLYGYTRPLAGYWELWVQSYDEVLDQPTPGAVQRRSAYHEIGHIIMEAAGFPTNGYIHHVFMNEIRLCPGPCPRSMEY